MGSQKYLSLMKLCGCFVGNLSSPLILFPYLKIPVVNIGNRQQGRQMADNIIQCGYGKEDIINSINFALSKEFKTKCENSISLYGEGNTSYDIVNILKNIKIDGKLLKKKLVWS